MWSTALSYFNCKCLTLHIGVRSLCRIALVIGLAWGSTVSAELLVIATGEYAPWTTSTGKHFGLINRIIAEAFKRRQYEVEFQFLPWARARRATDAGHFDASSYWFRNAEYEQQYLLSDTIFVNREVLFHLKRTPLPDWEKLEDLSGFRFGATLGYSYTDEFWALGKSRKIHIEETASDLVNFRKLLKGRIEIFPCEEVTGWKILNHEFQSGIADLVTTHERIFRSTEGTLLFSRRVPKSQRLLADFNAALAELREDGTIEKFYDEMLAGIY